LKEEKPLVYIVLLNYNGAEDTVDCLKSLEKVAYSNMQVVVVDNASTDDSVALLRSIQNQYGFVFLQSNENNGFSAGNNIGIKYALENNADYVLLLNNDTVVEPDFLSVAVEASEHDDSVGLTIGKILYYKEPDLIWYGGGELKQPYNYSIHLGFRENQNKPEFNQQRYVTYATGCYFLLKRTAIEKVGLMDEDYFLYCEDTDYSIRMIRSGLKMLYCPQSVIYHKVSASTGKGSAFSTYYIARNNIILFKRFFSGKERAVGLLYWFYKMFRSMLKGNLDRRAFWKGIRAGQSGEVGKTI
jgi:GT2 family glycosyltransferase